jgi:hypothetical protein
MLTDASANLIGALAFVYLFWKRLKEDYLSEQLFTTAFFVISGIGLGLLLAKFVSFEWWFWLSLTGVFLGTGLSVYRFSLRVFETVEALAFALLPWLGLVFVADSIDHLSLTSFIAFMVCAVLLGLFIYFDKHYKNFSWYVSGRLGFSGLTTCGLFFSLRALVAIFFPFVLSFVGKWDFVLSLGSAILFYYLIFRLAKKQP